MSGSETVAQDVGVLGLSTVLAQVGGQPCRRGAGRGPVPCRTVGTSTQRLPGDSMSVSASTVPTRRRPIRSNSADVTVFVLPERLRLHS
jgi:hypothetical protein